MSTSASKLAITIFARCFSNSSSLSTQRATSLQTHDKKRKNIEKEDGMETKPANAGDNYNVKLAEELIE
jgi:hypothetical protein